ncbi:SDR family NAD(P)-dependent oxidoreductase [Acuticoccus sp.]|uniref:SDR family NAD(P)-dependent oxidoreductase n=1 Tax=Acuticoccus sp. TaxID=1904378 RepID=UPI003B52C3BF
MVEPSPNVALIVGAGPGFSGAIARQLLARGWRVALASRRADAALAEELGGHAYRLDAGDAAATRTLFAEVERDLGTPSFVMYNPSARVRGPFVEIDPAEVERALRVTAYGGFLVAQEAARRMVEAGEGSILLTGATASMKGVPLSAAFAMGKFALRGLAQSMARELQPKGVHVLHVVIDGAILPPGAGTGDQDRLDPEAIATTCLALLDQPRSAWTWEVEVRPYVERF